MSFCSHIGQRLYLSAKHFWDAIMDRKREILNFVRDKRLNVVEELHEKER